MSFESTLRAMAENYRNGHSFDHLDTAACLGAADELRALKDAARQPDVKRRETENSAFHAWWISSGHAADPTFTLTTQNCAHAAWQACADNKR